MLSTLLGAKLGAALAAGAVGFGGIAVAAAAGVLPDAAQNFAHNTVGAPAANHGKSTDHKPAGSTTSPAVGPDASGKAAFGLCTAWEHAQTSGKAAEKSIAFRNLATAAGGKDGIATYCRNVAKPAADGTGSDAPGTSATHPTGTSATHPTGKPSPLPGAGTTGKPSPLPGAGTTGTSHRP